MGQRGGVMDFLSSYRYFATRNQSEWRDYDVPDPQADGLYAAAARSLDASRRGAPVKSISGTAEDTDWQPAAKGTLLTQQRFHPVATMLFRNIIGQPIQNRPAANLTHFLTTSGYGGVMPLDAQPLLDKPAAWNDPTRGRP